MQWHLLFRHAIRVIRHRLRIGKTAQLHPGIGAGACVTGPFSRQNVNPLRQAHQVGPQSLRFGAARKQ